MRYALIGDIHANFDALETVLTDIENRSIDKIICLGDVVGYGAEPARCVEKMWDLGCETIAGNHDWAAIEKIPIDFFNDYAKQAAIWTREQLSPEHKSWLKELPLTRRFDDCAIAHGTFHRPEAFNYITTVFDAQMSFAALKDLQRSVGFIGHSHVPVAFFDTDPITYTLDQDIPRDSEAAMMVNIGSVGQPRDENPQASYCIFDSEQGLAQIIRLDYDIDAAAAKIREAGLPEVLAMRLYQGK